MEVRRMLGEATFIVDFRPEGDTTITIHVLPASSADLFINFAGSTIRVEATPEALGQLVNALLFASPEDYVIELHPRGGCATAKVKKTGHMITMEIRISARRADLIAALNLDEEEATKLAGVLAEAEAIVDPLAENRRKGREP